MVIRTDSGSRSLTNAMVLDVVYDTHVPDVEDEGPLADGVACTQIN
jgi:hypothetical protein